MERERYNEAQGWFPAQGSYEEAVLTWHEQIEQSFRRRYQETQRGGPEDRFQEAREASQSGAPAE